MKLLDLLATGTLFSAVVSCASSTVYTYSGINNEDGIHTNQITKLQSFKELNYLLYDKLAIDDYLSIDESGISALEKLSNDASASVAADEYLRGDEHNNDNGHLIVLVNDEVSSSSSSSFASASFEGFVPVFEIDQNAIGEVNEHQLLSLLLAKYPDLSITVNQNNVKVLSSINSDDGDKSSNAGFGLLNEKLHLFQQSSAFGGKSDNEKALFELKLLEMSLFPKRVFTVNNDDDKTFAIVTLKVSDDSRVKPALVQEAVATLVKQAYDYGIGATVIYTSSNYQQQYHHQQTSRNSIASAQFRRAQKDKKAKLSSKSSFASEEECIYSTNNCNTHGLCSKNSASNKWSCICASSFNKTTKATTHWSGSSCNKIDISAEFNLLFWSSLLIVVTVVGAVVLIFKMDQEPLPGILGAATSESFKN